MILQKQARSESEEKNSLFRLSQKANYGLLLTTSLAKQGEKPTSLQTIAQQDHLSFFFLQRVAVYLRKANIIQAARGKQGGYTLARDPKSITIKEILEALEGPIGLRKCLVAEAQKYRCIRQKWCMMRPGLSLIHGKFIEILSRCTLSDFTNACQNPTRSS